MHFQLNLSQFALSLFIGLFCITAAWGDSKVSAKDETEIKSIFSKYEQVLTQQKTALVPQVFSAKFLSDNGGQKAFEENVKAMKEKPQAYDLAIQPGLLDKDVAHVKMIMKDKSEVDTAFIMKRQPSGEWRIEGTITDEK